MPTILITAPDGTRTETTVPAEEVAPTLTYWNRNGHRATTGKAHALGARRREATVTRTDLPEPVPSSALRTGDVVLTHGMRVLLDAPIRRYDHPYGPVFACLGTVLNVDDLDESIRFYVGESARWTIQGNDLARWNVQRRTCSTDGCTDPATARGMADDDPTMCDDCNREAWDRLMAGDFSDSGLTATDL